MKKVKVTYTDEQNEKKEFEYSALDLVIPMDAEVGDTSPEAIFLLDQKLMRASMRAADTGVSSKNLLHWKSNDILLRQKYAGDTWSRFNYIEYVWLQIIKELREFGLSLELIKKIKDDLIFPEDLFKAATKKFAVSLLKADADLKDKSLNELKCISEFYIFHQTTTNINNLLCECIARRVNFQLVVFKNGDAYFLEEGEQLLFKRYSFGSNKEKYVSATSLDKEEMRFRSNITISILELLRNYVLWKKHSLTADAIPVLTANEMELLHHIQRNDVKQITISYKNQKPYLIEVEENKSPVDMASRFSDHIMKGGYQSISYQTENGKMVSFNRTTKIKLK